MSGDHPGPHGAEGPHQAGTAVPPPLSPAGDLILQTGTDDQPQRWVTDRWHRRLGNCYCDRDIHHVEILMMFKKIRIRNGSVSN